MHKRLNELAEAALNKMELSVRQTCPTCKRGAAGVAPPDLDDLEALVLVRDGFDDFRRNFSPEMADRFRRFDNVIGYLHALIVGSEDGSL